MFFIMIIALIAAGIYTHAVVWYVLAGVLGGLALLLQMVALMGAGLVIKKVNKDLKDFDKGFESDFFKSSRSSLTSRPTRYRR